MVSNNGFCKLLELIVQRERDNGKTDDSLEWLSYITTSNNGIATNVQANVFVQFNFMQLGSISLILFTHVIKSAFMFLTCPSLFYKRLNVTLGAAQIVLDVLINWSFYFSLGEWG